MSTNNQDTTEKWLTLLIGLLAIFAIKSIFENDNSKIVSVKGKKLLSDDKKMQDLNKKILKSEKSNSHNDIFI